MTAIKGRGAKASRTTVARLELTEACQLSKDRAQADFDRRVYLAPKPRGYNVVMACCNDLCTTPEHVLLRKWKKKHRGKWAPIAEELLKLRVGGFYDLPEPGYKLTQAEKTKIRCGITSTAAGKVLRLSILDLPKGGIRIVRKEDW